MEGITRDLYISPSIIVKVCVTGNEYDWLHTERTTHGWARCRCCRINFIRRCWFLPCPSIFDSIHVCSPNRTIGIDLTAASRLSETLVSESMCASLLQVLSPIDNWIQQYHFLKSFCLKITSVLSREIMRQAIISNRSLLICKISIFMSSNNGEARKTQRGASNKCPALNIPE